MAVTVVTIRIATVRDVNAVAPLFDAYRQFYAKPADLPLAARYLRDRIGADESIVLVAETGGRDIVGFCQLYPTYSSLAVARICVLYDLYVAPAARRTGAGKALLIAAADHARREGFAQIELQTAKTNRAAQALYESLGWVCDEAFLTYNLVL